MSLLHEAYYASQISRRYPVLWLAGAMVLLIAGAATFITTDTSVEDTEPDHTPPPETGDGPDLMHSVAQTLSQEGVAEEEVATPALGENTLSAKYQAVFDAAAQLDHANKTEAADPLMLDSAWLAESQTAKITDFEPARDTLLFVWDDTAQDTVPSDVTVQTDPSNTAQLQVWMGDEKMAQVSGASDLAPVDISLIPLSSAEALSLIST